MKLLFCPDCYDIAKIEYVSRRCRCGAVIARYLDDEGNVEISGVRAHVLAVPNYSLDHAIRTEEYRYLSPPVECYLLSTSHEKVRRVPLRDYHARGDRRKIR